jgi:hypothetical protein
MSAGQLEQHLLVKKAVIAIQLNSIVELGKISDKIQINSFLSINKVIFIEYELPNYNNHSEAARKSNSSTNQYHHYVYYS